MTLVPLLLFTLLLSSGVDEDESKVASSRALFDMFEKCSDFKMLTNGKRKRQDFLTNQPAQLWKNGKPTGMRFTPAFAQDLKSSSKRSKMMVARAGVNPMNRDMRGKFLKSIPSSLFRPGANTDFGQTAVMQSDVLFETVENKVISPYVMMVQNPRVRGITTAALSRINFAPQLQEWMKGRSNLSKTAPILQQDSPWKTSDNQGVADSKFDDGGSYRTRNHLGMFRAAGKSAAGNSSLFGARRSVNLQPQNQGYERNEEDAGTIERVERDDYTMLARKKLGEQLSQSYAMDALNTLSIMVNGPDFSRMSAAQMWNWFQTNVIADKELEEELNISTLKPEEKGAPSIDEELHRKQSRENMQDILDVLNKGFQEGSIEVGESAKEGKVSSDILNYVKQQSVDTDIFSWINRDIYQGVERFAPSSSGSVEDKRVEKNIQQRQSIQNEYDFDDEAFFKGVVGLKTLEFEQEHMKKREQDRLKIVDHKKTIQQNLARHKKVQQHLDRIIKHKDAENIASQKSITDLQTKLQAAELGISQAKDEPSKTANLEHKVELEKMMLLHQTALQQSEESNNLQITQLQKQLATQTASNDATLAEWKSETEIGLELARSERTQWRSQIKIDHADQLAKYQKTVQSQDSIIATQQQLVAKQQKQMENMQRQLNAAATGGTNTQATTNPSRTHHSGAGPISNQPISQSQVKYTGPTPSPEGQVIFSNPTILDQVQASKNTEVETHNHIDAQLTQAGAGPAVDQAVIGQLIATTTPAVQPSESDLMQLEETFYSSHGPYVSPPIGPLGTQTDFGNVNNQYPVQAWMSDDEWDSLDRERDKISQILRRTQSNFSTALAGNAVYMNSLVLEKSWNHFRSPELLVQHMISSDLVKDTPIVRSTISLVSPEEMPMLLRDIQSHVLRSNSSLGDEQYSMLLQRHTTSNVEQILEWGQKHWAMRDQYSASVSNMIGMIAKNAMDQIPKFEFEKGTRFDLDGQIMSSVDDFQTESSWDGTWVQKKWRQLRGKSDEFKKIITDPTNVKAAALAGGAALAAPAIAFGAGRRDQLRALAMLSALYLGIRAIQ